METPVDKRRLRINRNNYRKSREPFMFTMRYKPNVQVAGTVPYELALWLVEQAHKEKQTTSHIIRRALLVERARCNGEELV